MKKSKNEIFYLKKDQIKSNLSKEYRQYFIGNLGIPQLGDYIENGDLEIGTSLYKEPKADTPHMHSKTSEILYILKGTYKILDIDKNEEYILNEGDFFVLPPKTPYASKANADTQVLFVKTGGNDKIPIEISERVKIWIGDLNE